MCTKHVYQTLVNVCAMEKELRSLRNMQNNSAGNGSPASNKKQTANLDQESTKIYEDHFKKVGEILTTHDPEHERDELCWVGDKQVSVNNEIAKLNMEWIKANSKVNKIKDCNEQENKAIVYKEFLDNAKKIAYMLSGAAGQASLILDIPGQPVEEVIIEKLLTKDEPKQKDA